MVVQATCPFPGCGHVSQNDDASIVVELLKIHGLTHTIEAAATSGGKMEKLKRPTISLAGTSETWAYFETGGVNIETAHTSRVTTSLFSY